MPLLYHIESVSEVPVHSHNRTPHQQIADHGLCDIGKHELG